MPRAKKYTIVRIVDGKIDVCTYENADAASGALKHIEDPSEPVHVFVGEPVPFSISREPTVTLGEPRGRKPRAAKGERKPRAPKKAPGTVVDETLFEKQSNGTAPTTETPAAGG